VIKTDNKVYRHLDKLGALYRQGYRDMKSRLDLLKDYLK
jgi:hypothetical protein